VSVYYYFVVLFGGGADAVYVYPKHISKNFYKCNKTSI